MITKHVCPLNPVFAQLQKSLLSINHDIHFVKHIWDRKFSILSRVALYRISSEIQTQSIYYTHTVSLFVRVYE